MLDCLMDVLNVAKLVLLTKLEVTWRLKLRHHVISCMADVTCMSGVLQKSFFLSILQYTAFTGNGQNLEY